MPRWTPTCRLLAAALALPVVSSASAGNRDAWPVLWDSEYIDGESSAVLHEELAPGVWSVYLRDLVESEGGFRQAAVAQELARLETDVTQSMELSWRAEGVVVSGELEIETSFIAAEIFGELESVAWVTAIVTTIHYELTVDGVVESMRLHHLDILDEQSSPKASRRELAALTPDAPAASASRCEREAFEVRQRDWSLAMRLDGDLLQLCLANAASCLSADPVAGRLSAACCVTSMLNDRAEALRGVDLVWDIRRGGCE